MKRETTSFFINALYLVFITNLHFPSNKYLPEPYCRCQEDLTRVSLSNTKSIRHAPVTQLRHRRIIVCWDYNLNATHLAGGVHARCLINCVAPDVENGFTRPDYATHQRTAADSWLIKFYRSSVAPQFEWFIHVPFTYSNRQRSPYMVLVYHLNGA